LFAKYELQEGSQKFCGSSQEMSVINVKA